MTIPAKSRTKTDNPALLATQSMLHAGLAGLQVVVDASVGALAESHGDASDSLAGSLATLLTRIASVAGELRKAEAEERRRGDVMSPEAVLTWFRGLPSRDQAGLVAEMEQVTSRRSGLA